MTESVARRILREFPWIAIVCFALALLFIASSAEPGPSPALNVPTTEAVLAWMRGESPGVAIFLIMACVVVLLGLAGVVLWALTLGDALTGAGLTTRLAGFDAFAAARRYEPQPPPWSAWDAVKLLAAWYLIMILMSQLAAGPAARSTNDLLWVVIVSIAAAIPTLVLVVMVLRWKTRSPIRSLGVNRRGIGRAAIMGVLGYARALPLVVVGGLLWVLILKWLLGVETESQEMVRRALTAEPGIQLVLLFLLASVIAPIVEETLFRGLLQSSLRHYLGSDGAVWATALLFGAAHASLSAFVPLFLIGLVLGYVYERSGSLLASMLTHALQNGIMLCLLFSLRGLIGT